MRWGDACTYIHAIPYLRERGHSHEFVNCELAVNLGRFCVLLPGGLEGRDLGLGY